MKILCYWHTCVTAYLWCLSVSMLVADPACHPLSKIQHEGDASMFSLMPHPLNFHFFTGKAISIVKGRRGHFCSAGDDPVISVHYSNIDRMWTKQFIIIFHPYSINIRGINMEIFDKLCIKLNIGMLPRLLVDYTHVTTSSGVTPINKKIVCSYITSFFTGRKQYTLCHVFQAWTSSSQKTPSLSNNLAHFFRIRSKASHDGCRA